MNVVSLPVQSRAARLIAQCEMTDAEIAEHVNKGLPIRLYRASLVAMWRAGEVEPPVAVRCRLERLEVSQRSSAPGLVRAS